LVRLSHLECGNNSPLLACDKAVHFSRRAVAGFAVTAEMDPIVHAAPNCANRRDAMARSRATFPGMCLHLILSGQRRDAITPALSLADDVRSNFGRHRQSQKFPLPACRVVRSHLYTAIGWHSVPPREEAIRISLPSGALQDCWESTQKVRNLLIG
jgi:hypothetical protein